MNRKIEITICLGSSCFARGNKKTVQAIEAYIREHNLHDEVFFHGGHCFGECENGPIVKINGQTFNNVDHIGIIDILAAHFDTE